MTLLSNGSYFFSEMLTVSITEHYFYVEIFHKASCFPSTSLKFLNVGCVVSWQKTKYLFWFSSWTIMWPKPRKITFVCCSVCPFFPAEIPLTISTGSISDVKEPWVYFRLFQINLDFCPSLYHTWKYHIKSLLFPGAIKSFLIPPAALTLALLFTAFNVGNSGI